MKVVPWLSIKDQISASLNYGLVPVLNQIITCFGTGFGIPAYRRAGLFAVSAAQDAAAIP